MDRYKFLTEKEILLSDKNRMIEQAKFTYSPLNKTFEKKNKKTIKDQATNQVEAFNAFKEEKA